MLKIEDKVTFNLGYKKLQGVIKNIYQNNDFVIYLIQISANSTMWIPGSHLTNVNENNS